MTKLNKTSERITSEIITADFHLNDCDILFKRINDYRTIKITNLEGFMIFTLTIEEIDMFIEALRHIKGD